MYTDSKLHLQWVCETRNLGGVIADTVKGPLSFEFYLANQRTCIMQLPAVDWLSERLAQDTQDARVRACCNVASQ